MQTDTIHSQAGAWERGKTAQTKYHLSTAPTLSAIDEKVWIYERFLGQKNFSNAIESSINSTAVGMATGGSSAAATGLRYNVTAINQSYDTIQTRYQSYFTLQTFYPDVMANAAYDISIDEFVVSDPSVFEEDITQISNNNTFKQNIFTYELKGDTINNSIYILNLKKREAA